MSILRETPESVSAEGLRIGIDLHVVTGKFQGSRTHVIELFSRVVAHCPEARFFCLVEDVEAFGRDYPRFARPNVELIRLPACGPVRRLGLELPRLHRALRLDLLHMQYVVPVTTRRCAVTIHDVLFESHPEYFGTWFRLRSRVFMRLASLVATDVFTVSDFSCRELAWRFRLDPRRICVIANGVDCQRFRPGADGIETIARLGLDPGGYILSVGRLEPRKNHLTLLEAYKSLGPGAPKLVLVGQRDFGFKPLFRALQDPVLAGRVLVLENVTDDQLPALYRHCALFAYPSFAEGFGIPPLEAMASGAPAIVADNTSLTEVAAGACVLVKAEDAQGWARAMRHYLESEPLRRTHAAAGFERARAYDWETAAALVAGRYRAFGERIARHRR